MCLQLQLELDSSLGVSMLASECLIAVSFQNPLEAFKSSRLVHDLPSGKSDDAPLYVHYEESPSKACIVIMGLFVSAFRVRYVAVVAES